MNSYKSLKSQPEHFIKSSFKNESWQIRPRIKSFATLEKNIEERNEEDDDEQKPRDHEFEFFQMCLISVKMQNQKFNEVLRMNGKRLFERATKIERVVFYKFYDWI